MSNKISLIMKKISNTFGSNIYKIALIWIGRMKHDETKMHVFSNKINNCVCIDQINLFQ